MVHNFAVNGATALRASDTPYWSQPVYLEATNTNVDAVFIMLGTNDSKTLHWNNGHNSFSEDYYTLIKHFLSVDEPPKIWVGKNLPAFSDKWTINNHVIEQQVHPIVEKIAARLSIEIIDLHSQFINQPSLFSDGIHPNYEGGTILVNYLYSSITQYCIQIRCK
uniref:GDSL-type esterase/lipase family protein n=1 Tax=Shewanella gaetbuli TaxID=220752 RepID=UPI003B593D7E